MLRCQSTSQDRERKVLHGWHHIGPGKCHSKKKKNELNHMNLEMFDKSLSVAVKMNRNTVVVPIVMYIRQALNKRRLHPSNVTTVVYETSINYCNENTEHCVLQGQKRYHLLGRSY